MNRRAWDWSLLVLASPVIAVKGALRLVGRIRLWRLAVVAQIPCSVCGTAISLLGRWKCACGYTYEGHLIRECPVCHSFPAMVRCYVCGATEKLPES